MQSYKYTVCPDLNSTPLVWVMAPKRLPTTSAHRASTAWSAEEDQMLIEARATGWNWAPISTKYFPTKTPNACRKRHERLMEKQNAEDWNGVKLEVLSRAYQEVRQEMWSILASRVGEHWKFVEQKCMEKGLKNLSAAARSHSRYSAAGTDLSSAGKDPAADSDEDMETESSTSERSTTARTAARRTSAPVLATSTAPSVPPVPADRRRNGGIPLEEILATPAGT